MCNEETKDDIMERVYDIKESLEERIYDLRSETKETADTLIERIAALEEEIGFLKIKLIDFIDVGNV